MSEFTLRRVFKKLRSLGLLKYTIGFVEWLLFGGRTVETALITGLGLHYKSRLRRDNLWSSESPHFTNNTAVAFQALLGRNPSAVYSLYRGFVSAEVMLRGDKVLDIGCGDGFFTGRFFAPKVAEVDGIDVESSSVLRASRRNAFRNVRYYRIDATSDPFPQQGYDVVVWDGALGHFSPDTSAGMISKIRQCIVDRGVFVGSESLGCGEGTDHLQFFETLNDLDRLFEPHFRYRVYRLVEYTGGGGGLRPFVRREAFWRCSNENTRLETAGWHRPEWYSNHASKS